MMKVKKVIGKLPYVLVSALVLGMCPVVSYAATNVAMDFQSNAVDKLTEDTGIKEGYEPEFEEAQDNDNESVSDVELNGMIEPVGISYVDIDISGKTGATTDAVYLNKGQTIEYSFKANNSGDKFTVGLINARGRKVGSGYSKKGQIFYKYTVNKSGEYKVYIANNNKNTIHVSGHFFINN